MLKNYNQMIKWSEVTNTGMDFIISTTFYHIYRYNLSHCVGQHTVAV